MTDIDSLFGSVHPWPWQRRAVEAAIARIDGTTRDPFVISGPTGSGKSLEMIAIMRYLIATNRRSALYTSRKLLTNQMINVLSASGLRFGVRAAEFESYEDSGAPIQICSSPTEHARVFRKRARDIEHERLTPEQATAKYPLEQVDVAMYDEIHMQRSETVAEIIDEHRRGGSANIGFSATPCGISHLFNDLVMAGTVSECRAHGALVPAHVYSCEELEVEKISPQVTGEYSVGDIKKKIWTPRIFGYVFENWHRLNPDGRQTLGFGPGVDESVWFTEQFHDPAKWEKDNDWLRLQRLHATEFNIAGCEEFYRHGVRAAHIDGMDVWLDGKRYSTTTQARADIIGQWNDGKIKIVWNRFVCRESLDAPSLYHLILATPIGSVLSYVQICGRVLRASQQTPDAVLITDHGGNVYRHGSPNEDRDWERYFKLPVRCMADARMDAMRDGKVREPITCPRCRAVRRSGDTCWKCFFKHEKSSRLVLQISGDLREHVGWQTKPRRVAMKVNTQSKWDEIYWQAYNAHRKLEARVADLAKLVPSNPHLAPVLESNRQVLVKKLSRAQTFNQIYGRFFLDHHYYPPRTLQNMPTDDVDWMRKVREVDRSGVSRNGK